MGRSSVLHGPGPRWILLGWSELWTDCAAIRLSRSFRFEAPRGCGWRVRNAAVPNSYCICRMAPAAASRSIGPRERCRNPPPLSEGTQCPSFYQSGTYTIRLH